MDSKTLALKNELIQFIRKQSYREGDFTLASGKKSTFYIDLKATTLHPKGADLIGKLALAFIRERGLQVKAVGGLTLGADPIATAVSLACYHEGVTLPAFIVRKEPKAHGTSQYIEGTENLESHAEVLVLEDVVTTGGSGMKAVERLRAQGYQPKAVLTVVDRGEGGKEAFEKAGLSLITLATIEEIKAGKAL